MAYFAKFSPSPSSSGNVARYSAYLTWKGITKKFGFTRKAQKRLINWFYKLSLPENPKTGLIESTWISSKGVKVSLKKILVWNDFVYHTDQQIRQHIGEERVWKFFSPFDKRSSTWQKKQKKCKISIRRRTIHSIKHILISLGLKRILFVNFWFWPSASQLLSPQNLPRTQTSLFRWKLAHKRRREGDNGRDGAKLPVCSLPMVPCGSSPVTRVSRSPLPCEKRSAWGGGCRRSLPVFLHGTGYAGLGWDKHRRGGLV